MQIPFPFEPMLAFGSLAIMLLIGVLLRAKVNFFQRFLKGPFDKYFTGTVSRIGGIGIDLAGAAVPTGEAVRVLHIPTHEQRAHLEPLFQLLHTQPRDPAYGDCGESFKMRNKLIPPTGANKENCSPKIISSI